jgi:hypothetical protein
MNIEYTIRRSNTRFRLRILQTWTLSEEHIWCWKKFIESAESDPELRAAILNMAEDEAKPAIARSKRVCAAIQARLACAKALEEFP